MQKENRSKNILITILSLLLLASVGGNVFQFFQNKQILILKEYVTEQVDSITIRKQELEMEFSKAIEDLEQYKGRSAELDSLLSEAYAKLEDQRKQISRLIETKQDYQVLQQRYAELRKTADMYLQEIEKLTTENKQLKYENTELSVALNQTKEVNKDLKGKVDVASKLKLSNISTKSYNVKSSGKEKETDKAAKTERITVHIVVDANSLASTGNKTVYLRLISPDGYVLGDVSQGVRKFTSESGTELPYSRSVSINYDGSKLSKSITWDQDAFTKGVYQVEIYIDGVMAGTDKITLY
ncbi:MAG: hypothetical protein IAE67_00865 [Candidatus Competibacteraceae bacterium]|nr:hypothetical protein [Candidatus Competibacteraceae bacterium]